MFTTNDHDLIVRGLKYVTEDLDKNRGIFDVGTLEREVLDKNYAHVVELTEKNKDAYTSEEKRFILRGLLHLKRDFTKSCELFHAGTIEREALDKKLIEIKKLIEYFE